MNLFAQCAARFALLAALLGVAANLHAQEPALKMDPEARAVLIAATKVYSRFQSYQHTEKLANVWPAKEGVPRPPIQNRPFLAMLALERPNRFCYKLDIERPELDAAVSNGSEFIHFRRETSEYTRTPAPADYKQLDLVRDVKIELVGSQLVALMLQGNALADPVLNARLMRLKRGASQIVDGKECETLRATSGDTTLTLRFDARTHLLDEVKSESKDGISIVETFEEVRINQPVDASLFVYLPPSQAKLVAEFTNPYADRVAEAAVQARIARYEGKPAPNFTCKDRNGKSISLSSLRGKTVVVDFWASWCGPCKYIMPAIQEIHRKYASKGVVVLVVDTWDTPADCAAFLKANPQYTMPVLMDPAGKNEAASIATKLYGVTGIPTTLFIDKKGIVRTYAVGAHPREFYMAALRKTGVEEAARAGQNSRDKQPNNSLHRTRMQPLALYYCLSASGR